MRVNLDVDNGLSGGAQPQVTLFTSSLPARAFFHPLTRDVGPDNGRQRQLGLDQQPEPEVSMYKHEHSHGPCGFSALSSFQRQQGVSDSSAKSNFCSISARFRAGTEASGC